MDKKVTYHEQTDVDNTLRLRDVLKTLPPFAGISFVPLNRVPQLKPEFPMHMTSAFSSSFFWNKIQLQGLVYGCFTVDVLDQITAVDLEEYEEYLKVYQAGDKTETNGERGLKRKMSSLRSFYAYYFKREMIHTNPTVLVDVPKIHQKVSSAWKLMKLPCCLDYIVAWWGRTYRPEKGIL